VGGDLQGTRSSATHGAAPMAGKRDQSQLTSRPEFLALLSSGSTRRGPPDQPPGLRRPGLLAAGRPGARLATRPTPTGTPKDPPRRRVTASLAHQNHGSGPGWRTTVRRVSQPPEAAKPLTGALGARFPLVHAHPYTTRFLSHSVTPQNSTRVFTITKVVRQVRQKATLQPSEAASRGALGPF
jgi:hypothetical protein